MNGIACKLLSSKTKKNEISGVTGVKIPPTVAPYAMAKQAASLT